ncbi:MAG: hypothetical protein ACRDO4_17810 [Nocardioides sp.]
MSSSLALATAVTFVWLGMVIAISFLEAPLKFRAPGVSLPIGLGIGRLVFRALNIAELLLAVILAVGLLTEMPTARISFNAAVPVAALAVQIGFVRPLLSQRSDRVLAGEDVPRSRAHYWYVGLEVVKIIGLLATGVQLLTT